MGVIRAALVATVLPSASMAIAQTNQLWFETADGLHGGPGQILELTINTADSATSTTFDIVAKANVPSGNPGWFQYAVDLVGDPADAGKLSADNWINISPFISTGTNGVGGSAPALMTGGSYRLFGGTVGGPLDLFSFTLTKEKLQGDNNTSLVEFVVGNLEFGQDSFVDPIPSFDVAGNGVILGSAGTSGGAVIRITNVPEPSTWALLSVGAIALIRRGRR
ncbi:MAG: PEP-CTERM sorting domain-containing protein [Phycisphaerales bacterium]|nr:PEP-CTERM sorting domain-containing protein [Phycisphaerales bacterium]